jgi:hypothetical protein
VYEQIMPDKSCKKLLRHKNFIGSHFILSHQQNGLLFFGVVKYVCLQRDENPVDPELCLQNHHETQEV